MAKNLMSPEKLRLVNNHLTPLAAFIVVPGLIVAPLPKLAVALGGILITFSVSLNYLSIRLSKRKTRLIGTLRVGSNYSVNIFLLWAALLGLAAGVDAVVADVDRCCGLPESSGFAVGQPGLWLCCWSRYIGVSEFTQCKIGRSLG